MEKSIKEIGVSRWFPAKIISRKPSVNIETIPVTSIIVVGFASRAFHYGSEI